MSFAVCIASASGSSGASTLCAALAASFVRGGRSAAVIDCNSGAGELDFLLGAGETCVYNAGDVLRGRCEPEDAVCEPSEGLRLIPAAADAQDAPTGRLRPLGALFEKGDLKSDFILLDLPHAVCTGTDELIGCADMVLLCCRAEKRDVRRASAMRRRMQRIGVRTGLVITNFDRRSFAGGQYADLDAVIDETGAQLIGIIPNDDGFSQAFDSGTVPESGAAVEAVRRIARRVAGERVPLPSEYV